MARILLLFCVLWLSSVSIVYSKTIVTLCEGRITDTGGADNPYPNNYSDTVTYCSSDKGNLSIKFDYFDVSAGDTLWIYAGTGIEAPLIGIYVQTSTVESIENVGCVTFRFKSDARDNGRGWLATVSCPEKLSDPSERTFLISSGVRYVCQGRFSDDGGTGNYSQSRKTQTFVSNTGKRIKLAINEFSVNFNNDGHWLRVYDGPSNKYPLIGAYNDAYYPPAEIVSSGTTLTFDFEATNLWAGTRSGWLMTFSCGGDPLPILVSEPGKVITACGGVGYDNGGLVSDYRSNSEQIQTFRSEGSYLKCNINNADFQLGKGDTLRVYDGQNIESPLKAILVKDSYVEPITASGEYLTFFFTSDAAEQGRGWQAFFTCIPQADTALPKFFMSAGLRSVCQTVFTDDGGEGGNYQPLRRNQTFVSAVSGKLKVEVSEFDINFNNDGHWLRIYDGYDDKAPLIGSYNSANYPPRVIISTGRALTFVFDGTNNMARTRSGWKFLLSCFDGEPLQIINRIKNPVCAGEKVSVSVQRNRAIAPGSRFRLELSDADGNFTAPAVLGEVSEATPFTIMVTIPAETPAGKKYRIRVISAPEGYQSTDGADPFEIRPLPVVPEISREGGRDTLFCQSIKLSFTPQIHFTYRWLRNGQPTDSTGNTFTVIAEGTYGLAVSGTCGTVQSPTGIRLVKIDKPVPFLIKSEGDVTEICSGDSLRLSVDTSVNHQRYSWKKEGLTVGEGTAIYVREGGQYSCVATNACGEAVSQNTLTVFLISVGKIEKQSDRLTAPEGESYRWLNADFSLIAGQTERVFKPSASGIYRAEVAIGKCKFITDTVHFTLPNSVDYAKTKNNILIIPNAARPGFFEIWNLSDAHLYYTVVVYDLWGRNLHPAFRQESGRGVLDMSSYPDGVYGLEIKAERQEDYFRGKIMLQK